MGMLYTSQPILQQIQTLEHPDDLSLFFLENIQNRNPHDGSWRILLAKQQLDRGELDETQLTLQPLLKNGDPAFRRDARLLDLQVMEMRMFAEGPDDQGKRGMETAIAARVRELLQDSPSKEILPSLADAALLAHEWMLATQVYGQLAQRDSGHQASWYRKGAQLALGKGAYTQAAAWYWLARSRRQTFEEGREDYLSALKALVSGNHLQKALRQAEIHLGDLERDDVVLKFLVKLGRAADNGAFAQKYVEKLLYVWPLAIGKIPVIFFPDHHNALRGKRRGHSAQRDPARFMNISQQLEMMKRSWVHIISSPAMKTIAVPHTPSLRPYDPEIYELAYTVYLENGKVEQAYVVARRAGQAVPGEMRWRRRWAHVAEWTGRPVEALEQWQVVAKQGPNAAAWATVVRMARSVNDDHALIVGLKELEKYSDWSFVQVEDLLMAYERVGQPEKAITQLRQVLRMHREREVFERLGLLYERMGHAQEAMAVYRMLHEELGSTVELATKRASLLYQGGNIQEAFVVLVEKQKDAPLDDVQYWETLGNLAWDLQDDAMARRAFGRLFEQNDLSSSGLERYILLVKDDHPQQAIEFAHYGWEKYSNVSFFLFTLDILGKRQQWDVIGQMLENVTSSQQLLLESHQQYWLVRAEVLSRKGHVEKALLAYREALRRDPDSPSIRLAVVWLLIDHQRPDQLEPLLGQWESMAIADSRFWGAFASAHMLVGQPAEALPYFERKFREEPHDYLWVLYYADALETAGYQNRAWNLRQHAWLTLRTEVMSGNNQAWGRDAMLVYARLALTREPGDQLASIFERLLHHDDGAPVQELMLSWYLSREQYGPARFWLWRQYGRQLSKPAFAELALALADNDWVAIDRLLTAKPSSLDRLQQVVAAKHLQRERLVQTLAFEGVEDSPAPELYARALADATLSHVSSPFDSQQRLPLTGQLRSGIPTVATRFLYQDRDPLVSQQVEHLWTVPLGRGFEFRPFVSRRWQRTTDRQTLRRVPDTDTRWGGHLQWDMGSGLGELTLYHRKALTSFMSIRGRARVTWDRRTTTEFLAGRNVEADTSVGMLIGGVKDMLRISHTYQASKWDSAFIQLDYPRFYSQDRQFLGQGFAVEGSWSHHLRLAYPDFRVRLSGSLQGYSRRSTVSGKMPGLFGHESTIPVSTVLPKVFRQIELGVGIGESVLFSYGKNIRPFVFGGVNVNEETGVGANISGGMNGSVFGPDRLSLFGRYVRGGFGQDSTVTEWGLHYQWWF